jgi:hypothetical protein
VRNKTISLKEESEISKKKEKEIEESMRPDRDKTLIDLKKDLFLREAFNLSVDYYDKAGR